MNTLNILMPYEYVSSLISLNWYDILFAVEQKFLSPTAATEHAILELEKKDNPKQTVIDLACLEKGDPIHPFIDELGASSEQNKKEAQEKFLFVLLNWVYEHKEIYSDQLGAVEIIYADFDYPQIISNFVRYMPSEQPLLGTQEENIKRLYNNWSSFLDTQKAKYSI